MKEIRKSFKILWYPFTKSKKKSYRINIFRKDGTFEKKYVNNGKVYAKGKYQLYNIDDLYQIYQSNISVSQLQRICISLSFSSS